MAVLPGSVSTSAHPARRERGGDAVGREVRLDGQVDAAGLEDREDRRHPVQVALGHHRDHALAAQPARQQRAPQPVGPRVQLPVGPPPVAVHGGDRVRVRPHPLLEQLVEPPVRQLAARAGQPVELERELLGGQQALPVVRGVRLGGDQRERGEVVAGDPGGGCPRRARRSGTAAAATSRPSARAMPTRSTVSSARSAAVAGRSNTVSNGGPVRPSSRRRSSTGKSRVRQQLRLDVGGRPAARPPGVGLGREPAGQRPPARRGDVAGHHLALAGQRGEHLGVRGQQHGAERHAELVRAAGAPPPARSSGIGASCSPTPVHRVEGPPRDRSVTRRRPSSPRQNSARRTPPRHVSDRAARRRRAGRRGLVHGGQGSSARSGP